MGPRLAFVAITALYALTGCPVDRDPPDAVAAVPIAAPKNEASTPHESAAGDEAAAKREPTNGESDAPPASDPAPPTAAGPRWPDSCLIEGIAVHPREPWLAAACTDAEKDRGAVLVFDLRAGTLRSVTEMEGYVGWASTGGLLRWHPDGKRLATNVQTNGIALLEGTRVVGHAFPDDTRDGGVGYVWIDHRIFTDTGSLFEIREGDHRFEFEKLGAPVFEEIEWNAATGAVVGRVGAGIAAFDPVRRRLLYHQRLEDLPANGRMTWSPDGRWCARRHWATPPAADELMILSGDDGRSRWTVRPSSPRLDDIYWGPNGALVMQSHQYDSKTGKKSARHLDVIRAGLIEKTIDLGAGEIQASHSVPEASGVAWSPSGDGLALLLDRQRVQLLDASTGKALSTFTAPAPPVPDALPDYYKRGHRPVFGFPGDLAWPTPQRLLRIAPHFVAVWSIDGEKIAEFIVPAAG